MSRRYWRHPFPYMLAFLVTLVYFSLPHLVEWLMLQPFLRNYAYQDTRVIVNELQKALLFPLGQHLYYDQRLLLIFPYWLVLLILLRMLYLHTQQLWKYLFAGLGVVFLLIWCFPNCLLIFDGGAESESIGHVQKGALKDGKRMSYHGDNFTTYSWGAYVIGRTHTHHILREVLLKTYANCAQICPNTQFVLGELGWPKGGFFPPHTAHQNGLSADFMVPVLKNGEAYTAHDLSNLWGYALEFDANGRSDDLQIDFLTVAQHLLMLNKMAIEQGLVIQKIIFNPIFQERLLAGDLGEKLQSLPFSQNPEVIRHDNHYHVDFGFKQ